MYVYQKETSSLFSANLCLYNLIFFFINFHCFLSAICRSVKKIIWDMRERRRRRTDQTDEERRRRRRSPFNHLQTRWEEEEEEHLCF